MNIVINIHSNEKNSAELGNQLYRHMSAAFKKAASEIENKAQEAQLTPGSTIEYATSARPFKFELNQLVDISVSEEFGEVRGRAQHADGGNQYLIHYKAATGCANTLWFDEDMLTATESEGFPGCPVFAGIHLRANGSEVIGMDSHCHCKP